MTALISEDDVIRSVADALQYISYYHPPDYIRHLNYAYETEKSPAAKDAIAQILVNSRMSALGKRPLCQDTGLVSAFVKVGINARFAATRSLSDLINEGVRLAYTDQNNPLRASIVFDPLFARRTRAIIRRRWFMPNLCPANTSTSRFAPRAADRRTRRGSSRSIQAIPSLTGYWTLYRRWEPAGVRPGSSELESEEAARSHSC